VVARLVTCLGLLFGVAAPAAAEWHLAPFFGLSFKGFTTLADLEDGATIRHWNFGGSVVLLGRGPIGVEGHVLLIPGFFENDDLPLPDPTLARVEGSRVLSLMGNVVLTTPAQWNEYGLRPFLSGGLGLINARQRVAALPYSINLLGYNVGGGAEGPLTDHTGLRYDVRYFRSLPEEEISGVSIGPPSLRFWTASIGFVFRY
jgi:hypothetical protein